jgi:iron(III) transport system substrate-binding protein
MQYHQEKTAGRRGTAVRWKRAAAAALAGSTLAGLVACSSGGSSSSATNDSAGTAGTTSVSDPYASYLNGLYQTAKKAGQTSIVLYSAYAPASPNQQLGAVVQQFEKDYPGISVTLQDSSGASLFAQIDGEYAAGQSKIDAVLSGPSDVGHFITQNRLIAWKPADSVDLPSDLVQPQGYYTVPFEHLFGLVYNTKDLTPSEVPTTIQQLTEPQWKGKIAIGEPNGASPSDFAITTLLYDHLMTVSQLKAIAANATIRGQNTAITDVISGEAEIGIWGPSAQAVVAAESGAPVAFQKFSGNDFDAPGFGIFTDAPHPDAAKLLEAWLISPPGQEAFSQDTPFYGSEKNAPNPVHGPGAAGDTVVPEIPASIFESEIEKYRSDVISIFGQGVGA